MRYDHCIYLLLVIFVLSASVHAVSVDSKVINALDSEENVPVIVMLKKNFTDTSYQYNSSEFENNRDLGLINGFSGRISREGLEEMLNDPHVSSIQLDKPVHAFLSDSVPLINATQVWALKINGMNITGKGETVCVVDTGIDYNHTSLGGGFGNRVLGGYNFCANTTCSAESSDPYDNNGHGTHVAGIIASNDSTYRGVAFESSLVAVKVLNSAGSGTDSSVLAGINWCVANATQYNISVISMSLGAFNVSNTGYCDSSEAAYSSAINTAVANNISVIVASGNDASNTSIAVPACIQNATSVGSTTKSDAISSFTDRNNITDLLAPGSSITSTYLNNGFATSSGTSMATPHVSGLFALLRQYKRLENGTILKSSQIENALKTTGLNISDSATGLNFSRVRAYNAIVYLDAMKPLLSISSPANASYNTTNISLSYSASDNVALDRCTFTNTTGASSTLSGCSNITFIALSNQQNNITVLINDSNGNTNSTQVFFTIDLLTPFLNLTQPQNTTYATDNISVNYSASDTNSIDRCWLVSPNTSTIFLNAPRSVCTNSTFKAIGPSLLTLLQPSNITYNRNQSLQINFSLITSVENNITVYANDTAGNVNLSTVFFTANQTNSTDSTWYNIDNGNNITIASNMLFNASEGFHTLNIFTNDSAGNINSSRVSFTIDTISPLVNFTDPTPNNQTFNTTNNVFINITINELPSAVLLEWNGSNVTINGSGLSRFYQNNSLADGNYTFRVIANDTAGNINVTAFRWVYINATRNFTSYITSLNSSLATNNVTILLLNSTGSADASSIFVGANYTLRFNVSSILAEIVNFSWLNANTSNVINVTRNITLTNISSAFNASGGTLDNYVWIDVNNFTTQNYTPRVTFNGAFRLNYYINGTRQNPDYRQINETCNQNQTNIPCYSVANNVTTIVLSSFSGAVVGNDTLPPAISVSSPSGTYSISNISLSYSASDNVALDKCWYTLNSGSNVTLDNCTNTTITAASGSNTLNLYANDTSGKTNSSSVSFTYSPPAPSSSSSSGGGGGGISIAAPNYYKRTFDVIKDFAEINISLGSLPVKSVSMNLSKAATNVAITVSPESMTALENAYQYFSINLTNVPTSSIESVEIKFSVNISWLTLNNYSADMIVLKRLSNDWITLNTTLIGENMTEIVYKAPTPGFSTFAITVEKKPVTATSNQTTNNTDQNRQICAQVITPAVKDNQCINYPTPCDVPENWTVVDKCPEPKVNDNGSLIQAVGALIVIAALVFIHKTVFKKKKQH